MEHSIIFKEYDGLRARSFEYVGLVHKISNNLNHRAESDGAVNQATSICKPEIYNDMTQKGSPHFGRMLLSHFGSLLDVDEYLMKKPHETQERKAG